MKRAILIFSIILSLFAFCSCNDENSDNENQGPSSDVIIAESEYDYYYKTFNAGMFYGFEPRNGAIDYADTMKPSYKMILSWDDFTAMVESCDVITEDDFENSFVLVISRDFSWDYVGYRNYKLSSDNEWQITMDYSRDSEYIDLSDSEEPYRCGITFDYLLIPTNGSVTITSTSGYINIIRNEIDEIESVREEIPDGITFREGYTKIFQSSEELSQFCEENELSLTVQKKDGYDILLICVNTYTSLEKIYFEDIYLGRSNVYLEMVQILPSEDEGEMEGTLLALQIEDGVLDSFVERNDYQLSIISKKVLSTHYTLEENISPPISEEYQSYRYEIIGEANIESKLTIFEDYDSMLALIQQYTLATGEHIVTDEHLPSEEELYDRYALVIMYEDGGFGIGQQFSNMIVGGDRLFIKILPPTVSTTHECTVMDIIFVPRSFSIGQINDVFYYY